MQQNIYLHLSFIKEKREIYLFNIENDTETFPGYANRSCRLTAHVIYTHHRQCMRTPEGREDIAWQLVMPL